MNFLNVNFFHLFDVASYSVVSSLLDSAIDDLSSGNNSLDEGEDVTFSGVFFTKKFGTHGPVKI